MREGSEQEQGAPAWRREARALALQGRLVLSALRRPACRLGECERAAVFVHGFMAAGAVFDPMREHVAQRTGLPTVDFTYGLLWTFEQIVERFASHVDEVVPRGTRISLVGHSLGGIVGRWWVQELGGIERVDRVVTLATPHAGTRSARWAPGSVAEALRPESPVIARLAARRPSVDVPHVVVVAGGDRMCMPPASAASLPGAEVHWLEGVGHNEMLFHPRVHDIVTRSLE